MFLEGIYLADACLYQTYRADQHAIGIMCRSKHRTIVILINFDLAGIVVGIKEMALKAIDLITQCGDLHQPVGLGNIARPHLFE